MAGPGGGVFSKRGEERGGWGGGLRWGLAEGGGLGGSHAMEFGEGSGDVVLGFGDDTNVFLLLGEGGDREQEEQRCGQIGGCREARCHGASYMPSHISKMMA